jgi:hypothetical protein
LGGKDVYSLTTMTVHRFRFTLAVLLLICTASFAQDASTALTDVSFRIRTKNDQAVFQMGEVIPLELSFTSFSPGKYQLNMANYDRSGRMNFERFEVSPQANWKDPIAVYYSSIGGYIGGGIFGTVDLSQSPATVALQLNEWVRFDAPGQYDIRVSSNRVNGDRPGRSAGNVVSNVLHVTIIPARPEWQASTLRSALSSIDAVPQTFGQLLPTVPGSTLTAAVKTLRYLGTPEAAREMARRIRGNAWDWDFMFGVIGSPAVSDGVAEMERLFRDPAFPVTGLFITTLSVSAVESRNRPVSLSERNSIEARYREELMGFAVTKTGDALAVTLHTIFEDAAMHSRELAADQSRDLSSRLASVFELLPVTEQADLLDYRWSAVDKQAMLPIIPRIALRPPDSRLSAIEAQAWTRVSGLAFKRWQELSPDDARPSVIEEILRPEPRFGSEFLGMLKDETLPSVEVTLAEHLTSSKNNLDASYRLSSLIERYATRSVESRILALLDPMLGKGACELQSNLLAYVVRVDPEAARPRLEKALASSGQGFSGCYRRLFTDVGTRRRSSLLQELAMKNLGNSDSAIAADARNYIDNSR